MRPTKKFTPNICKKEGSGYTGFVEYKVPSYDERNSFFLMPELDDLMLQAAEKKLSGGSDADIAESAQKSLGIRRSMLLMNKIKDQLGDWISEISITRIEDGFVFTNYETEVKYDSDLGSIGQEIVNELIGKYRFGNPNMPQS